MPTTKKQETKEQTTTQNLNIERIYIKDISLETPGLPEAFQKEWKPEIFIDLNVSDKTLEENFYEVTLALTITAKEKEKILFLIEIEQAGIFNISGFEGAPLSHILGAYCPSILFPYAREMVNNLVSHTSLPQFSLAPVNFDAIYREQLKTAAEEESKKKN